MLSYMAFCLFKGLMSVCLSVRLCIHACHVTPVEVRGQLCRIGPLFSPLCGFWEPNSGRQVCVASTLPTGPQQNPDFCFLKTGCHEPWLPSDSVCSRLVSDASLIFRFYLLSAGVTYG